MQINQGQTFNFWRVSLYNYFCFIKQTLNNLKQNFLFYNEPCGANPQHEASVFFVLLFESNLFFARFQLTLLCFYLLLFYKAAQKGSSSSRSENQYLLVSKWEKEEKEKQFQAPGTCSAWSFGDGWSFSPLWLTGHESRPGLPARLCLIPHLSFYTRISVPTHLSVSPSAPCSHPS